MTLPTHRTVGDYEKLEARVAKLRQILIDCCFAVGGAASADVSDEFLGGLPAEVTALATRCAVNLRDLLALRADRSGHIILVRELFTKVVAEVSEKINTPGTPEHTYVHAPTYEPGKKP